MLLSDLFVEGSLPRNGTLENGIAKFLGGYHNGYHALGDTCYAYAGSQLAKLGVQDATVRFWGRKASGLVVHGDAVLPDGTVISDRPESGYAQVGYELVASMPLRDLLSR